MSDPAVSIRIDDREFMRMINAGDRIYRQSAAYSLNKSMAKVRTQVTRRAAKSAGVKQSAIRHHSITSKANRMKHVTSHGVLMSISARHLSPKRVGTAPQGRKKLGGGVKAGSKTFQRAFIAKDLKGVERVFRRAPSTGTPKSHDFSERAPDKMVGRGGKRPGSRKRERGLRSMKVYVKDLDQIMATELDRGAEYLANILPKDLLWRLQRAAR